MIHQPFLIILTATINPRGMCQTVRANPADRQRDYLLALQTLLNQPLPNAPAIVFFENGGADLAPFQQIVANHNPYHKRVEFISIDLQDFPRSLGKGYGEFRTLHLLPNHSPLFHSYDRFVKLTGRLWVKNLPRILAHAPTHFDLVIDVNLATPHTPENTVDSRLMLFSRRFFDLCLLDCYKTMNDSLGLYAEHVIFNLIRDNPHMNIVPRLPLEPYFVGVSGTTGKPYNRSLPLLRHLCKTLHRWTRRPKHLVLPPPSTPSPHQPRTPSPPPP